MMIGTTNSATRHRPSLMSSSEVSAIKSLCTHYGFCLHADTCGLGNFHFLGNGKTGKGLYMQGVANVRDMLIAYI